MQKQQDSSLRHISRISLLSLSIWAVLTNSTALAAQDAQSNSDKDDEKAETIEVVTARRYAERIQDVPVAVTSISELQMNDMGAQTLIDLERTTPNLTLNASRATNSTITAYIRGIGQNDPLWGFEPGVGVYIDDVYMARPQGGVLDLLDVERVEILRGPQGTLYGKNTMGGAIKYVTRELPDFMRGYAEVVAGSYHQRDIKAGFSTPLGTDKLLLGLSIAKLSRDGFGEVLAPSPFAGDEVSDKDIRAARVNISWKPSDTLSFKLVADDVADDSNIRGGKRLNDSVAAGYSPLDDRYDTRQNMDPSRQEVNTSGMSLTAKWQITDASELKFISATRDGDTLSDIDFDATHIASFDVPAIYEDEQTSHELQYTWSGDDLDFVAGLYAFDGDACGEFAVRFGLANLVQTTYGCVNTKSQSIYAQGSYRIDEHFSFTLGGRSDKDEKDATVGVTRVLGTTPLAGGEFVGSETFDDFSPRIGFEYKLTPDHMLYVSRSHGFKSGGFNMRANPALDSEAATPFDPETVDANELGYKGSWLDNRVKTYVTYFQQDYQDKQVPVSVVLPSGGFVSRVLNAADADLDGYEVELSWSVTEAFAVRAMYGRLDGEYNKFVQSVLTGGVEVDIAEQANFINAPDEQYTIGVNYDFEFSFGTLSLLADYNHRSTVYIYDFDGDALTTEQKPYSVWNASMVYTPNDSAWRFALHGRNLGDEEYRSAAYDFSTTSVADRLLSGYYGDPKTWSLSAMYSF